MAKIKDIPINIKDYYKEIKAEYSKKLEEAKNNLEKAINNNKEYYSQLQNSIEHYKRDYSLNLNNYQEFVDNKFIDGKLRDICNKLYRNAKEDCDVRHFILLVKYSKTIEEIYTLNINIVKFDKIANITYDDFKKYLRTYYYEVQRQMIVNGAAYKFQGHIGAICINRCKNRQNKPILDTKATKANKAKLIAEGKEIYNAKKEQYYKEHGLEYNGIKPQVYMYNDYLYEFVLIWSGLQNSFNYKYEPYDYWAAPLRKKTKEDFKKESNGNLNYICQLDIKMRLKVRICTELDNTLYLKFIRNENQSPITTSKNYR